MSQLDLGLEVAAFLLARLRGELREDPRNEKLRDLCAEMEALAGDCRLPDPLAFHPPSLPIEFAVGGERIRMIGVIATFGTPLDVTVSELRMEPLFPADPESEQAYARLCR